MRSPRELARGLLVAAALVAGAGAHADEPAPPASADQVQQVVQAMKADPTLNGKHLEHRLRWKPRESTDRPSPETPHWLRALVRWVAEAGRGVVWVLAAVAVALFAVFAWRWASVRSDALRARTGLRPSHVNELDIRPESLPADIADAARALCRRGELRAALSLLYRGALSRLVHDHQVPIRAASTEGECVRLAARVLPAADAGYFERLVAAWQTEVYAGRAADAAAVSALCDAFDAHFAAQPNDAAPAAVGATT